MRAGDIEYHMPETLPQACALLSAHGAAAALLAGGTDVVSALKHGVLGARHLVSLKRIPGLSEVSRESDGGLTIGALVKLCEVAESAAVRSVCAALAEAAGQAGSPLLRNRGTLGGNVCLETRCWFYNQNESWRASRPPCLKAGGDQCYVNRTQNQCVALFSADTPAALITGRARVRLAGPRGERSLPIEDLYSSDGLRPLTRENGEILTAVTLPAPRPRSGSAYLKYSVRESIDFPVLGIAASVALDGNGGIGDLRLAVTGVKPAPMRLVEFEAALRDRAAPRENDSGLAGIASRTLGTLYLTDTVPHKRHVAGLMAVEAVCRAAAAARDGRAA